MLERTVGVVIVEEAKYQHVEAESGESGGHSCGKNTERGETILTGWQQW